MYSDLRLRVDCPTEQTTVFCLPGAVTWGWCVRSGSPSLPLLCEDSGPWLAGSDYAYSHCSRNCTCLREEGQLGGSWEAFTTFHGPEGGGGVGFRCSVCLQVCGCGAGLFLGCCALVLLGQRTHPLGAPPSLVIQSQVVLPTAMVSAFLLVLCF